MSFSNLGYIDPKTGAQVAFPYSDRYQDWVIAVEWFTKAKQDFSYYGTGEIGQFYINKIQTMISTNDPILTDAYAIMIGGTVPFQQFGAVSPVLITPEGERIVQTVIINDVELPSADSIPLAQAPTSTQSITITPTPTPTPIADNNTTNTIQTSNIPQLLIIAVAGYGLYEFFKGRKR